MSVVWAFPGQGSQRKNMGADLFDRYPGILARADAVLGRSVRELSADQAALRDTRVLQPVLYTISALTYLDLAARQPQPDFMIGHSLGEYSALYASGALDFETGLRLVVARAEIMGRTSGGGMLAVVGLDVDRLREIMRREGADDIDVANHNSPVQTVLSGPEESIRALAPVLRREGAGKCVLLHISVAAHSRYMAGAAEQLGAVLDTVTFREPRVPVVSNVTARPHRADAIAAGLREHMCRGVRWWESLAYLIDHRVTDLVEVGPGQVLTKLWAVARTELPAPTEADVPERAEPGEGSGPVEYGAAPATASQPEAGGAVTAAGRGTAPMAAGEAAPADVDSGVPVTPSPERSGRAGRLSAQRLGAGRFRERYGLTLAWVASGTGDGAVGARACRAARESGLLAFADWVALGPRSSTARDGTPIPTVSGADLEEAAHQGWGVGLRAGPDADERVDLLLAHDVRHVEADHPHGPDAALVRYRFSGARRGPGGTPVAVRHVIARVTGLEQAAAFLRPPSPALLDQLVLTGALSAAEADVARELPVASDLAVESPAGWRSDGADAYQLLPSVATLAARCPGPEPVHVGLRGVVGTPEQAATAFALGASFLVATSLTACAPAARLAEGLKRTLARATDDDVTWAPAERHRALGVPTRVVRRGTLFPARAGLLHRLLREHRYFADVPEHRRRHIEEEILGAPVTEPGPYDGAYAREAMNGRTADASWSCRDSKVRTADVFRRYLRETARRTAAGDPVRPLDHQLPCDPELTHFNRAAAETGLADRTARDSGTIAEQLLTNAAALLAARVPSRAETRP
ncbi:ACP S-malonyltransferase [Streptomyces sp. NPDC040750]|uniref:ACP S-malonyltransferase n=1 Tax=Streptomyces sp. NPDC040750 TaxID=3154491 RepID=UPI00340427B7